MHMNHLGTFLGMPVPKGLRVVGPEIFTKKKNLPGPNMGPGTGVLGKREFT